MTTPTLDSGAIDLGVVQKPERVVLENNLFKKKLPFTDSSSNIALDIFGKTRTLYIKGMKSGTEAQLKTFVETIDSWANANSQERKVYKSSLNKTYYVRADVWSYDIYANHISYTLILVEAGTL